MKVYLRSLENTEEAPFGHKMGDVDRVVSTGNGWVAYIGERKYSAIYNPFVDAFFVDDRNPLE